MQPLQRWDYAELVHYHPPLPDESSEEGFVAVEVWFSSSGDGSNPMRLWTAEYQYPLRSALGEMSFWGSEMVTALRSPLGDGHVERFFFKRPLKHEEPAPSAMRDHFMKLKEEGDRRLGLIP